MNSSNSSKKSGNTKQISPAKHWVFTLNNYTTHDTEVVSSNSSIKRYIFQEETGESGTPHLQGYVEFQTKMRPMNAIKFSKAAHWEKCKNIKASIEYCHKGETRTGKVFTNIRLPKPLKLIKPDRAWQKELLGIINEEPNDRIIYWLWEQEGGVGKSQFTKYLCAKKDALLVSGKGSDAKYLIKNYEEVNGVYPELIVFDIPRSKCIDYVSWESLEKIKDGCFASTKYECAMVIMNSPHIICFANEEPPYHKLSSDRWRVGKIKKETIDWSKDWRA